MLILGIDPGATTGWCVYDTEAKRAVDAGEFPGHAMPFDRAWLDAVDAVAIERLVAQGPTRPEVVEASYIAGRLAERLEYHGTTEIRRLDVRKALTKATHGEIFVKNDATAWAALQEIHGEGSGDKARTKKGAVVKPAGAIGIAAGSDQRAALAVAWTLAQQLAETQR